MIWSLCITDTRIKKVVEIKHYSHISNIEKLEKGFRNSLFPLTRTNNVAVNNFIDRGLHKLSSKIFNFHFYISVIIDKIRHSLDDFSPSYFLLYAYLTNKNLKD